MKDTPMHSDGEQQVCQKCNGTGSYKIPISSPSWPTANGETTSVPCECKLRGDWKPQNKPTEASHSHIIEEVEKDFTKLWVKHIESGAIEPTSLVLVSSIFSLLKRKGV